MRDRMRMPQAGQYDKLATIWQNEPTYNADRQPVENGVEFIERWVNIRSATGRGRGGERFQAQQMQADVSHLVRMHSDTQTRTITPKMWLTLHDGTRLDITRIVDIDNRHIELELECNQRV